MSISIDHFNKMLLETVCFLDKKFPTDRDINYALCQLEMAIPITPRLVVSTFTDSMVEYIPKIEARDESFFINLSKNDEYLQCFNLHDKWSLMTTKEQDYVFSQIAKLVKLGTIIKKFVLYNKVDACQLY